MGWVGDRTIAFDGKSKGVDHHLVSSLLAERRVGALCGHLATAVLDTLQDDVPGSYCFD